MISVFPPVGTLLITKKFHWLFEEKDGGWEPALVRPHSGLPRHEYVSSGTAVLFMGWAEFASEKFEGRTGYALTILHEEKIYAVFVASKVCSRTIFEDMFEIC